VAINSSDLIPKERLSAYQRWELACLEAELPPAATPQSAADAAAAREATERELAREQGYAKGYETGMAQAAAMRARFEHLLQSLTEHAGTHQQKLLDEVLNFALILAQRLVGEAVRVRRDLVLPVVAEALKQLPQAAQRVQLAVHPDDVELVRAFLDDEHASPMPQIVADASISAGGCRVDTGESAVDATLESRWCRILLTLGQTEGWIDAP